MATKLRVARAYADLDVIRAAATLKVSRQTWHAWERGDIPAGQIEKLEAWCRERIPQTDTDKAHAFGMLDAAERVSVSVAEVIRDARLRLGDPQLPKGRASDVKAATLSASPASSAKDRRASGK